MIITRGEILRKQYFFCLVSGKRQGYKTPPPPVPALACYCVGINSVASTLALIQ